MQDKLQKLLDKIKDILTNPVIFISIIVLGDFQISPNLLLQLNSYFRTLYPSN